MADAKKDAKVDAKVERPLVPAAESRFDNSAEYRYPLAAFTPPAGTPWEHLLRPEYWANIKKLRPGYRIFVFAEDEAYYGTLLVRRVGQGYALMHEVERAKLDKASVVDPKIASEYDIEFLGPVVKHRILRLKDKHVIKQGIDTLEEAQAILRDHLRAVAA